MAVKHLAVALLIVCAFPPATQAVSIKAGVEPGTGIEPDLKVGLVLSGGGAKGIAHIGVIQVLEEAGVRIDYVTGTSMGSIIGALYAIGYSPEQMLEIASSTDWDQLFSDRPNRRLLSMFEKEIDDRFIVAFPIRERGINLPSGVVSGQNIMAWLNRYTWPVHHITDFSQLPIPYAAVATDLETGEAVVFRSGFLPDAIRASISLPSAMTPYTIDGKTLIDGGLSKNLPVEEVLEMGADIVIAVDVTTPLHSAEELRSLTSILNQAVHFRMIERLNEQKELADMVIRVEDLDSFGITDFNQTHELASLGRQSANRFRNRLREISARQSGSPTGDGPDEPERIRVQQISVSGNEYVASDVILAELTYLEGSAVKPAEIETHINRLYSTRLFRLISYRLHRIEEEEYHVEIRVQENQDDTFRAGARYESKTHASLILQAAFRNPYHRGSSLRLGLRLGQDTEFLTDYLIYGSTGSRLGFNTRLLYAGENVESFEGSQRLSSLNSHLFRADLFAGTFMNRSYLLGIGIRKDFEQFTQRVNTPMIPFSDRGHHAVYGQLFLDTFNRRSFTTRGNKLLARASFSDGLFGSPLTITEQTFYWQAWHPLSSSFSLQHTLYLGRTTGDELPWSYWYSPNRHDRELGMVRFGGYSRYELTGRNIQMGSVGLQYEVFRHRFIRLQAYAGQTSEAWNWNPSENRYRTGYSVSTGALTVLGPVELILSGSPRNPVLWELQVGYDF